MNNDSIYKINELLQPINKKCIEYYELNIEQLVLYVDSQIKQSDDLKSLIGSNQFEMVHNNHKYHSEFMYNMFLTKDPQTMYTTYIWAYQTYNQMGFSFKYFHHELIAWQEAIQQLDNDIMKPIVKLYEYLITLHDEFIKYATLTKNKTPKAIDDIIFNKFLSAILKANVYEAINISNEFIKKDNDVKVFWEHIILPALYSVGNKWAEGKISVGEEHTATSICQRVMSEHYPKVMNYIDKKKRILVTTSPNELHEVGALMLSDMLELNGYDVYFISSKISTQEKCDIIFNEKIDVIIISTTLVGNISKTKTMIDEIRNKKFLNPPLTIVGGQAFKNNIHAANLVNADYCLENIEQLLKVLEEVN